MNCEHRNLLLEERLVLVSPFDPSQRFTVTQAMQRNRVIYALAEAGLVVHAEVNRGGTWAGAVEQLKKYNVPVFVRSNGDPSAGLEALLERGARPWPEPEDPDALNICVEPRTSNEVAGELGVSPKTAGDWLKRLVDEGTLVKEKNPVRYERSLFG